MTYQTESPQGYITALQEMISKIDIQAIESAVSVLLKAYENGNCIFIFGNGGSGTTSSHMAGDFIKGVSYGLDKKFKMICLNDNFTTMTAFANDVSYDLVFVEPLKNFLQDGDVVIGLSGSGNSRNVVLAFEYAALNDVKIIGFSGYSGGKVKELADVSIYIPIDSMEIAEDLHLSILHMIKNRIITELHGGLGKNLGQQYLNRVN
jgi:D-sedoheptulose 7-phosphate isomerase